MTETSHISAPVLDIEEICKIHKLLCQEAGILTPKEFEQIMVRKMVEQGMSYRQIAKYLEEVQSPSIVASGKGIKLEYSKVSRSRVMRLVNGDIRKRGAPASTLSTVKYDEIKSIISEAKRFSPLYYGINADTWTVRTFAELVQLKTNWKNKRGHRLIKETEIHRVITRIKEEELRAELRTLLKYAHQQVSARSALLPLASSLHLP